MLRPFALGLCFAGVVVPVVQASEPEPVTTLGQVVAGASNSTALQARTGEAVQKTCGSILGASSGEGFEFGAGEQDLLFRCGEMVNTANALAENEGSKANNLGWTSGQLAEAMQQLTGEEQVSQGRLATETSNGQFANIGMRLDAIRSGVRATSGGLNLTLNDAPLVGGNAGDAGDDAGWGWFLNGAYGFGDRDSTGNEDEYDYDSYGSTLGFDYRFDSGLVAGVALGYASYEVDFENVTSPLSMNSLTSTVSGGGFETDGYSLSTYAIGNVGRFYVDGVFSYGTNDVDNERKVSYQAASTGASGRGVGLNVDRTMTGSTESETLALGVSTGTSFELGVVDMSVDAGISYLDITVDGYTEKDSQAGGGLNLTYEDQDIDSLQSSLGVQFTKSFSVAAGVIVPYLGVDWLHEFENSASTVKASYAAHNTANKFALNVGSDDPDEDYFAFGVGVSALFSGNLQAFVDYSTSLGLDNVNASLLTFGVRGSF